MNRNHRDLPWTVLLLLLAALYVSGLLRGHGILRSGGNMTEAAEEQTAKEQTAAGQPSDEQAAEKQENEQWLPETEETPYYQPDPGIELPAAYDSREQGRIPAVKDQGSFGTCWAFASIMALESRVMPEEQPDYSEDHMSNDRNFTLDLNQGGEYTMAMAYLLSWQGPVLERDDPYGDGVSPTDLEAVKHVQEIQILPEKDYAAIKQAVMVNGSVQSSLYTSLVSGENESEYYHAETRSYSYHGAEEANHDIVIVGWDDNYPKENFSIPVEGDGAFLCANSWGQRFGEDGFFYVSYYDTNIGIHNVVYTLVEETDNYDFIYQSDLCGWIGQIGYGQQEAWAANIYQAGNEETLEAVGFYATGPESRYEVYIVRHVPEESPDFSEKILAARGTLDYAGYYTVPLQQKEQLEAGERYGIIVRLHTADAVHPIAIEYDAGDGKCAIDLEDGEGYLSPDGTMWERVEETQHCNLCLKAYTDRTKKE